MVRRLTRPVFGVCGCLRLLKFLNSKGSIILGFLSLTCVALTILRLVNKVNKAGINSSVLHSAVIVLLRKL